MGFVTRKITELICSRVFELPRWRKRSIYSCIMASRRPLVIDCDPGNDDAMAILMALNDPGVEVKAITCVEGNTNVTQTGRNALRTLQLANRLDIPVFIGCNAPLLGDISGRSTAAMYHGTDGLGDVPDPGAPDDSHLQSEHAVQALLRLAKEFSGHLNLVAIGPLTNVAMAIRLDPTMGQRLQRCYIMGGNYLGKGNVTSSAEFNFYFDPEAAYVVLNELCCPITLVPWETCLSHPVSWEKYHRSRDLGTPKAEFMKKVDKMSIEFAHLRKHDAFIPADEATMACCLRNDVITKTSQQYATVELKGSLTRGQMVVDWRNKLGKQQNVDIVEEMDQKLYETLMFKAFDP